MGSLVWFGVVWCGVVWFGVVWCGVVWCGVVWCGVVWCDVVWDGVEWRVYPVSAYGLLQGQAHHSPRSSGTRPPREDHQPPT